MKIYQTYLLIIISAFIIAGCSKKDDKPVIDKKQETTDQKNNDNDEIENPQDTIMSPEELFSSSIMDDFLDSANDDDLQDYIETELYKYSQNYNGVSMIALSPSTWFVSFEKDGNNKNYILQRYIDFKTSDYYFRMKETTLTANDIAKK